MEWVIVIVGMHRKRKKEVRVIRFIHNDEKGNWFSSSEYDPEPNHKVYTFKYDPELEERLYLKRQFKDLIEVAIKKGVIVTIIKDFYREDGGLYDQEGIHEKLKPKPEEKDPKPEKEFIQLTLNGKEAYPNIARAL